jgi:hypothetical protein
MFFTKKIYKNGAIHGLVICGKRGVPFRRASEGMVT